MRPLYQMTEELESLLHQADDPPSELCPDTLTLTAESPEEWFTRVQENLETVEGEVEEKIKVCARFCKNLEVQEEILAEAKRSVSARMTSVTQRRLMVLELVNSELASLPADTKGKRRVKSHLLTVSLQANNPSIDSDSTDLAKVVVSAPDLVTITAKLDKATALRNLKETGELPDGIALTGEKYHVRIRI